MTRMGKALGRVSAPIPDGVPELDAHPIRVARPPVRLDRDRVPYRPMLGGNDRVRCCTAVAVANAIHAQAALAGWDVAIDDAAVLRLYGEASGYHPDRPDTDRGCVEVDMLVQQAQHGFATNGQTAYVGLWANLPVDDLDLLRVVTARMGCAYLGVLLAEADEMGGVWDTDTPSWMGDPTPGSWGAHALLAWSYDGLDDTSLWQLATWGRVQMCTTRWLRSRLEEAHALYHPQMLDAQGRNAAGVNRERLAADVASFGAPA